MTAELVLVRLEKSGDSMSIRAVHESAFPTLVEANLVDALRVNGKAWLSLVDEEGGQIVGYVLFSPVTLTGQVVGVGLAPVAVIPKLQKLGLGNCLYEMD